MINKYYIIGVFFLFLSFSSIVYFIEFFRELVIPEYIGILFFLITLIFGIVMIYFGAYIELSKKN